MSQQTTVQNADKTYASIYFTKSNLKGSCFFQCATTRIMVDIIKTPSGRYETIFDYMDGHEEDRSINSTLKGAKESARIYLNTRISKMNFEIKPETMPETDTVEDISDIFNIDIIDDQLFEKPKEEVKEEVKEVIKDAEFKHGDRVFSWSTSMFGGGSRIYGTVKVCAKYTWVILDDPKRWGQEKVRIDRGCFYTDLEWDQEIEKMRERDRKEKEETEARQKRLESIAENLRAKATPVESFKKGDKVKYITHNGYQGYYLITEVSKKKNEVYGYPYLDISPDGEILQDNRDKLKRVYKASWRYMSDIESMRRNWYVAD